MRREKGFTLVELLVVVLILGALAAIAIPRISQSAETAKINACKTNVDLINSQIELYYANTGEWPEDLDAVVDNNAYFPDGAPECPFGTDYIYNETKHRVGEHTHE
jgi:prepilin-type N-terminal cleavage/methylation domain-containing protein